MSRYDALEEAVVGESSFLDRLTIKLRLVLLIVAVGVIFCIGTSIVFFQQFSSKLYDEKKNQTSYMTEAALNVIQMYADKVKKGELPLKEAQEMAKASIANMKYDNGNYIWINNFEGTMLVHPNKALIGETVANIKDKKTGKPFFAEISTEVQQKGIGTSDYYWTKPGHPDSQSFPKVSYGYGFAEWKWVIATGTYIDDIEADIQQTLISILGLSALMLGAIIFAAYFTIARSIINPIEKLSTLSLKLAENDLRIVIPEDNNKTEIGNLNRAFKKFVENLRELVEDITKSSEEISAGTEEINAASEQSAQGAQQVAKSSTQLAEGSQQIAQSISHLATGSQQVSGKISELAGGAKQISKNVTQLTEGIQLISQNVEDGANSLNKMNLSIQDISTEAGDIAKLGNETEENANTGKEFIKKAVDKINSIREVSGEISDTISELGKLSCEIETIVDLIKNIAGQTNLLALNAAIEAARAGEHGKGFAVVAEEVKKLAGQSEQATGRITQMIKEIQNKTRVAVDSMGKGVSEVDDGVYVINDVGNALGSVIEQVRQTNSKIQGISQEIGGVAKNSDTIVKMIENISSITEQTVANAQEISTITEQTASNAEEISSITEETAASAEEISSVTQETAASAEEISSISEEQTASSEEISASIQSLVKIVETLHTKVSKFKI